MNVVVDGLDRLAAFLGRIGPLIMLPTMVLIMVVDSALRYLVGAPLLWSYDVVSMLLLCFFFVCLPHSVPSDAHVRMSIFYERFGERARAVVDVFSALGALLFGSLIAYRAIEGMEQLRMVGKTTPTVPIPHWPFSLFLFAMASLFCVIIVARLVRDLVRLARPHAR